MRTIVRGSGGRQKKRIVGLQTAMYKRATPPQCPSPHFRGMKRLIFPYSKQLDPDLPVLYKLRSVRGHM